MTRKIVVAVDKSPEAKTVLDWATNKIFNKDDHVIALYCTKERILPSFGGLWPENYWEKVQKEELETAEEVLRNMRIEASKLGIELNTEAQPGPAADAIVEYCKVAKADLLIMGREANQPMFTQSVSTHCITHAPCPVLVARAGSVTPDGLTSQSSAMH